MQNIKSLLKEKLVPKATKENTKSIDQIETRIRKIENRLVRLSGSGEDIRIELEREEIMFSGFEKEKTGLSEKIERLLANETILVVIASLSVGIVASALVWLYANIM